MKNLLRYTLYLCLFSLFVLCFTSCDSDTDLVAEYVILNQASNIDFAESIINQSLGD